LEVHRKGEHQTSLGKKLNRRRKKLHKRKKGKIRSGRGGDTRRLLLKKAEDIGGGRKNSKKGLGQWGGGFREGEIRWGCINLRSYQANKKGHHNGKESSGTGGGTASLKSTEEGRNAHSKERVYLKEGHAGKRGHTLLGRETLMQREVKFSSKK